MHDLHSCSLKWITFTSVSGKSLVSLQASSPLRPIPPFVTKSINACINKNNNNNNRGKEDIAPTRAIWHGRTIRTLPITATSVSLKIRLLKCVHSWTTLQWIVPQGYDYKVMHRADSQVHTCIWGFNEVACEVTGRGAKSEQLDESNVFCQQENWVWRLICEFVSTSDSRTSTEDF